MAAKLTYDVDWYNPRKLKSMMEDGQTKEIRKEYTRLRDISQKRLKRLAQAGYDDTQVYLKNVNHYPKLKDIKSESELASRLSDLSRFITAKASTVTGQKDIMYKSLKTLHDDHYYFVNEGNFREFGKFMEEYRFQMQDLDYDSGDAADLYGVVIKHKLDPKQVEDDFNFWLENVDKAKELRFNKASAGNFKKMKARLMVKSGQAKTTEQAMKIINKGVK